MALWNLSDKTVLIIDDFAQMRSMLLSMLKNYAPKSVVQAANGKEAIEKMQHEKFDIVLCDYNLGKGKDGQQVLEEAKHLRLMPFCTLFIMVTAENTNAMVMGAAEYMPDAYLSKPINKNILISRLQKLLLKKELLFPLSVAIEKNDLNNIVVCCDDLLTKNIKFKFELLKIKCEHLLKLHRDDEAMKIAQSVLEERNIPWAMMISGQVHINNKNTEEAEKTFHEIIDTDKNFMPAYDSLAKMLEQSDKNDEAQNILMEAVKISPKSVLRQRELSEVAVKNKDFDQVEISRKKAVDVGKSSCFKKSSDYTELADIYIKNNSPQKAIDVLNETTRAFKKEDKTILESHIKLASAYKKVKNNMKYSSFMNSSLKLANKENASLHGDTALELARACMELGKIEESKKLITSVVKEYFENEEMMSTVSNIFEKAGLMDEGENIISIARAETIKLNNKGVKLIKNGEIDEAVKLFEIAVKEMPGNVTVNLNIATSLMLHMQKNGADEEMLHRVDSYLNIVFKNDSKNPKALDVKMKCQAL